MSSPLRLRDAARAVVLDPDGRILLVRFEFPDRHVWACPGGGLEPGESHEDALRRELREEVGLEVEDVGPCIWTRSHVIPFLDGRWDGQVERFFLVEVDPFEPVPLLSLDQLRAEFVTDLRWWSADELAASREIHAPRRLAELVADLREVGRPPVPIDAGV
ncbi:MAG TPA: NUDIX domain-containing protein [Candidatus Limnocylindria bacterium]|nr:NUDIX domain-containing protein [Candidatus Limnocylindria bacterium]